MIAKLTQTERTVSEGKHFIRKLEEDNAKLRRALEQSMTTVNRMSLDSDNCVDRLFHLLGLFYFIFLHIAYLLVDPVT